MKPPCFVSPTYLTARVVNHVAHNLFNISRPETKVDMLTRLRLEDIYLKPGVPNNNTHITQPTNQSKFWTIQKYLSIKSWWYLAVITRIRMVKFYLPRQDIPWHAQMLTWNTGTHCWKSIWPMTINNGWSCSNSRSLIIYNAKLPEKAVLERLANTLLTLF